MTYLVHWSLEAIQELSRIEQQAVDPAAVRTAAAWVDYTLRRTPLDMGESRSRGYRLWFSDVLGVYYRVDERAQAVWITTIGPARRRR